MTLKRSTIRYPRRERNCTVCARPTLLDILCHECGESYDKHTANDKTTAGLVMWAARRARRFERGRKVSK